MHSAERRDDESRPGEGLERKQPRPAEGEDQPGGAVDSRRSPGGESLYIRRFDWLAAGLVCRLIGSNRVFMFTFAKLGFSPFGFGLSIDLSCCVSCPL